MRAHDKPLKVSISNGVLRIEIGVDTLARAYIRSEHAWKVVNPDGQGNVDPEHMVRIKRTTGFARDVVRELMNESEDGSTLLTRVIDQACAEAVEQGSIYFISDEDDDLRV